MSDKISLEIKNALKNNGIHHKRTSDTIDFLHSRAACQMHSYLRMLSYRTQMFDRTDRDNINERFHRLEAFLQRQTQQQRQCPVACFRPDDCQDGSI